MGLVRLLLFAFALWLLLSGVRRLLLPPTLPRRTRGPGKEQEGMLMTQDPHCGRFVAEREAVRTAFRGQVLYFCSVECRDLYLRNAHP
ncbi:MAG: hypothetical protein ACRERD_13635 [Candidatus Binatia bacterium]